LKDPVEFLLPIPVELPDDLVDGGDAVGDLGAGQVKKVLTRE
jgi:hypothetical protein